MSSHQTSNVLLSLGLCPEEASRPNSPAIRRFLIHVLIVPAEEYRPGHAFGSRLGFGHVDDDQILLADGLSGKRLDDVVGEIVANVLRSLRLLSSERRQLRVAC